MVWWSVQIRDDMDDASEELLRCVSEEREELEELCKAHPSFGDRDAAIAEARAANERELRRLAGRMEREAEGGGKGGGRGATRRCGGGEHCGCCGKGHRDAHAHGGAGEGEGARETKRQRRDGAKDVTEDW